jgi:hypothetical protein
MIGVLGREAPSVVLGLEGRRQRDEVARDALASHLNLGIRGEPLRAKGAFADLLLDRKCGALLSHDHLALLRDEGALLTQDVPADDHRPRSAPSIDLVPIIHERLGAWSRVRQRQRLILDGDGFRTLLGSLLRVRPPGSLLSVCAGGGRTSHRSSDLRIRRSASR